MKVSQFRAGIGLNTSKSDLIAIEPGTYEIPNPGMDSEKQTVQIREKILAPRTQVTVSMIRKVAEKFGDSASGLFLTRNDTKEQALYAVGTEPHHPVADFDMIDPLLLPPSLGIGNDFEKIPDEILNQLAFGDKPKHIIPDDYSEIRNALRLYHMDQSSSAKIFERTQAIAIALLLGHPDVRQALFGSSLNGKYYARLLSADELDVISTITKSSDSLLNWANDRNIAGRNIIWQTPYQSNLGARELTKKTYGQYFPRGYVSDTEIQDKIGMRIGFFSRIANDAGSVQESDHDFTNALAEIRRIAEQKRVQVESETRTAANKVVKYVKSKLLNRRRVRFQTWGVTQVPSEIQNLVTSAIMREAMKILTQEGFKVRYSPGESSDMLDSGSPATWTIQPNEELLKTKALQIIPNLLEALKTNENVTISDMGNPTPSKIIADEDVIITLLGLLQDSGEFELYFQKGGSGGYCEDDIPTFLNVSIKL